MDISSLLNAAVAPSSQLVKGQDTLAKLLQLSGIDARVIRVDKSGVLLATRLGEILGKNSLDLKQGDSVRVRLDTGDSNPVLKVTRQPPEPILLKQENHKALFRAMQPNQTYTALIVRNQPGNSKIQMGNIQYPIAHQVGLKKGQLVNLATGIQNSAIELKPVNTEQVLKSLLTLLLPRQPGPESGNPLSQLLRYLDTGARQAAGESSTQKQGRNPASTEARPATLTDGKSVPTTVGKMVTDLNPPTSEKALPALAARLISLLKSIPDISTINSRVIQQWLGYTGLIKATDAGTNPALNNPLAVLQQLPGTEASLKQLIQLLFSSKLASTGTPDNAKKDMGSSRNEPIASMVKDILRLIDQSVNQLMFQKVNARHQQELQQPIALNLTIPFADRQSINDLHLKIRQKEREAAPEKQCWDIHLSFEFGNLGLISSHINLDGDLLSTSFWSTLSDTKLKIEQAIPEFKQQLSSSGFTLGQFHSFAGTPPQDERLDMNLYSDALLDIKV
jgi:hypothetical protein